jgi:hypothetical protein
MVVGTPPPEREPTSETGVCLTEHQWLVALYRDPSNAHPKFRLADLLGGCIALCASEIDRQQELLHFLCTEYLHRPGRQSTRRCDVFPSEFDLLTRLHRAPWNLAPNPRWDYDQLATGCVAVVSRQPCAQERVLEQARINLSRRAVDIRLQPLN